VDFDGSVGVQRISTSYFSCLSIRIGFRRDFKHLLSMKSLDIAVRFMTLNTRYSILNNSGSLNW